MGWSIAASNGTVLVSGTSYTPTSSRTLYAQWVTTSAASSLGSTTATLNGTATSALSPVSFCYGTDSALSGCTTVSATGSYTANVTGLTASTLYYFRVLGTANSTSHNGGILSFTTSSASPTTYIITASAGSNGSISPSGSVTVNAGDNQSFTISASSGYEINVLIIDSIRVSNVATYTFINVTTNHTISVTFKAIASGGRGNSENTPASNNVKIVVQRVLVGGPNNNDKDQTTTTTTSSNGTTTTTTITPGTSTNSGTTTTTTESTSGTTTTTTTTAGPNSNASATGVTAASGGLINSLTNASQASRTDNNGAIVEALNTTTATSLVIDKNVPSSVSVERTGDNKIIVQGINGWTGRVSVAVVDESNLTKVQSFIEVAINPLPVSKVVLNNANSVKEQKITFSPSPSEVVKYQVVVNNKVVCESLSTSCVLPMLVGSKSKVEVVAQN
jgi:hypothetical protein